jgi:hypothetical protein
MMVFSNRRGWSHEMRLAVLFFGAAIIVNFAFSHQGWGNTLMGKHGFRPVQTAVSTFYFLRDGIDINYKTPLLGTPGEMPLEFPFFQAAVAMFVRLTGVELDAAGGIVSWLFFLSALPAGYLLLAQFKMPAAHRLIVLSLILVSPLYLFFSRNFLIESTALTFSLWFLLGFTRFLSERSLSWLLCAIVCGTIGGLVKVTTLAVFLIAALLVLVRFLRTSAPDGRVRLLVRAAVCASGPFLASVYWVIHSAAIRHRNPETAFLDTHFGFWSFGDVAQRISLRFWLKLYEVWSGSILNEAGIALIILYYCWLRGRYRWAVTACLTVFIVPQLIFSNLYFVHDYYFYANGVFLVAALGFCLAELIEQTAVPAAARWTFIAAVMALHLGTYAHLYLDEQRTNISTPPITKLVEDISSPDDLIIILGIDWDGYIPYYAQRPALMLRAGRERDPESIRKSIARLDPSKVAALVIFGAQWRDQTLIAETMGPLKLGDRPLFSNNSDIGVWVPVSRHARLRDEYDPARHPMFSLAPEANTTGKPKTILEREISRLTEFEGMHPLPVRATALNDFTFSKVDNIKVLNAHATTELVFRGSATQRKITAVYGILPGAYDGTATGFSDGVEFVVSARLPGGTEKVVFRRFLNPHAVAADRGSQALSLPIPETGAGSEIVLRTLPGPSGNASYDWSYWGAIHIDRSM